VQKDVKPTLRAGKGLRIDMTSETLSFLSLAISAIETAWDSHETLEEVFKAIGKLEGWTSSIDEKFGSCASIQIPYRAEDGLRISVFQSTKTGKLSIDVREWFQPH
jgi:hypothetical protein